MAPTPKQIAKGKLVKIKGFAKTGHKLLVECEFTTGKCYINYELMKEKFPEQLIDYYMSCSKMVKI